MLKSLARTRQEISFTPPTDLVNTKDRNQFIFFRQKPILFWGEKKTFTLYTVLKTVSQVMAATGH